MWSKEQCQQFFKKLFGLSLQGKELDNIYEALSANQLTPISRHGGNNVGFTPLKIQELVRMAMDQTDSTIDDPRFKKIKEEVLPACTFTLTLKKLGYGEFVIVSSDVPDIILVDVASAQEDPRHRANAVPIEAIFPPKQVIESAKGTSFNERLAQVVVDRKFTKRYGAHTCLLITVDARGEEFNAQELSSFLLLQDPQPFHQVWVYAHTDSSNLSICTVARLVPDLHEQVMDLAYDLGSVMF